MLDELSSLAPITDLLIEGVDSQSVAALSGVQKQSHGLMIHALCVARVIEAAYVFYNTALL